MAQGIITTQGQLVVAPAQATVAVPGTVLDAIQRCCVDDDGNIAWLGNLRLGGPTGVTSNDDDILCIGRTEQDQVLLARQGMPTPDGTPGSTLVFLGNNVVAAPHGGQVAWLATTADPSNNLANTIYLSSASGHTVVCRTNDPLPAPLSGTLQGLGSSDLSGFAISASGHVLVHGYASGAREVVLSGQPGQLETALYRGKVLSSVPSQPEVVIPEVDDLIAPDGSFPFRARLLWGSGNPAVTPNDDAILGAYRPGQGVTILARRGEPAPGTSGANYYYFTLSSENIAANGEFTFRVALNGPGVTPGVNDQALYRASVSGGVPQLVFRSGDPLGDGSVLQHFLNREVVGQHGEVGFWCGRSGPNVTSNNDEAFLLGAPGAMSVLFHEGDPLPSLPGAAFGWSVGSMGNTMDRHGNLVLRTTYRPAAGGEFNAMLAYHPVRGWTNLILQGDAFTSAAGRVAVVSDAGFLQRPTGSGATSMHTLDGDIVRVCTVDVTTHNGVVQGQAIVRTHLGDLRPMQPSIPATGGLQALRFDAGPARAGDLYLMLGSMSGTSPGFQYGGFEIPLVNDFWFGISQQSANSSVYLNSFGTLDAAGTGVAAFALPWNVSFLRGATFHHAVLAFDPSTAAVTWVSRPATVHVY